MNNKRNIAGLFSIICFFGFMLSCTSCAYVPEKVQVAYEPIMHSNPVATAIGTNVVVNVIDNRRNGKRVSSKKGDYGIELAGIKLEGELADEVANAVITELESLGCTIATGGMEIEVEIQKFYNEFKQGFFRARGIAELILAVSVKKSDGNIVYSKTIMGFGENDKMWVQSGKNAKAALDTAFNDAIHRLVSDQAFLQSLKK
ncbi:MAG: hypothetical protein HKM07_01945 [Chlamydiae bacterium]|nr:hypothetical protein [Chlamydiota bacterium]